MMNELISKQKAIDAIQPLYQEHRYRIAGKAETYSQYNEAWQDALARVENVIFNLPSFNCHGCIHERGAKINCFGCIRHTSEWVDNYRSEHDE